VYEQRTGAPSRQASPRVRAVTRFGDVAMSELQKQKEDLSHDTAHPLYPYGYGLTY
jgi:hypothetical protein